MFSSLCRFTISSWIRLCSASCLSLSSFLRIVAFFSISHRLCASSFSRFASSALSFAYLRGNWRVGGWRGGGQLFLLYASEANDGSTFEWSSDSLL
jgi:hypothetical protein